jgi:hypothetical protein
MATMLVVAARGRGPCGLTLSCAALTYSVDFAWCSIGTGCVVRKVWYSKLGNTYNLRTILSIITRYLTTKNNEIP